MRRQVLRVNIEGMSSFNDRPRSGRPPTYSAEEVATVVTTALTHPKALELPFASRTLDRLAAYLDEHKGIAMKCSRIDEILLAEGLRWRKHETWFGERVDPEFTQKRGRSRRSTLPRCHHRLSVPYCVVDAVEGLMTAAFPGENKDIGYPREAGQSLCGHGARVDDNAGAGEHFLERGLGAAASAFR